MCLHAAGASVVKCRMTLATQSLFGVCVGFVFGVGFLFLVVVVLC